MSLKKVGIEFLEIENEIKKCDKIKIFPNLKKKRRNVALL